MPGTKSTQYANAPAGVTLESDQDLTYIQAQAQTLPQA